MQFWGANVKKSIVLWSGSCGYKYVGELCCYQFHGLHLCTTRKREQKVKISNSAVFKKQWKYFLMSVCGTTRAFSFLKHFKSENVAQKAMSFLSRTPPGHSVVSSRNLSSPAGARSSGCELQFPVWCCTVLYRGGHSNEHTRAHFQVDCNTYSHIYRKKCLSLYAHFF